MLIAVLYQILMFIGGYILLGRFKIGDEFPDLLIVDAKFSGCRADGDFILDDGHE